MKPIQNLLSELLGQIKKPFTLHNPDAIIFPVALCGSFVFASLVITSASSIGINLGHLLGIYDLPNLSFFGALSQLLLGLGVLIPVALLTVLKFYLTSMSFPKFRSLVRKHLTKKKHEVVTAQQERKKDCFIVTESKKFKTSEDHR